MITDQELIELKKAAERAKAGERIILFGTAHLTREGKVERGLHIQSADPHFKMLTNSVEEAKRAYFKTLDMIFNPRS
jgi:hypothetical protein